MTAGLATFAKVRALHDRTTNAGEKASAAARMQTLARKAGMTVEQAVSKLDAPKPAPATPRNLFEELFNTPEMRAARAERQQRNTERRTAALAEYGSEHAVWAPNERERALEQALAPLIVRKPIINGEMDTLQGWDGGRFDRMPPDVQGAVAVAYAAPASVQEAWAEFWSWEKVYLDRLAFCEHHDHDVRVRARTAYIEHLLDTMPARSMNDLRIRLDWMEHINTREWNRGNPEDATLLATLRADIERMGARIREQDAETAPVQSGHPQGSAQRAYPSPSPDPATSTAPVQSGQATDPHTEGQSDSVSPRHPVRRTNADKRRDVLALLKPGISGFARLTDREIARRAGVSPSTVGTVRKSLA